MAIGEGQGAAHVVNRGWGMMPDGFVHADHRERKADVFLINVSEHQEMIRPGDVINMFKFEMICPRHPRHPAGCSHIRIHGIAANGIRAGDHFVRRRTTINLVLAQIGRKGGHRFIEQEDLSTMPPTLGCPVPLTHGV